MKLTKTIGICFFFVSLNLFDSYGQEQIQKLHKLAPLNHLAGGEWELNGRYQAFEWSLDKQLLTAKSYTIKQDTVQILSEGIFFWHPEKQVIKGFVKSINMPVDLFDYTTQAFEDSLQSKIFAYGYNGAVTEYMEIIHILNDSTYEWKLYEATRQKVLMQGIFKRTSSAHLK